jgi:CxxC motif-containing protein (DUF1111 family)
MNHPRCEKSFRLSRLPEPLAGACAIIVASLALFALSCTTPPSQAPGGVHDPGVRGGDPGAGGPLPGLTPDENEFFEAGREKFLDVESVADGLGPRFNSNQCASCHSQPAIGGSSPASNPMITVATLDSAKNIIPWFITADGPIREARFIRNPDGTADGGVHALFVISGRTDAPVCGIAQPTFTPAGDPKTGKGGNPNITFRIPTPLFGGGLIEAIPDEGIVASMHANASRNTQWGIAGRPNAIISGTSNLSGNDGTITRFGWKAQNKSLLIFSGEAYNVEMGVTNQLFPQERGSSPACTLNATPEDATHLSATSRTDVPSDAEAFAIFMRLLAPPTPAPDDPSIIRGRAAFSSTGCVGCHTPTLTTGTMISSGAGKGPSAALSNRPVNLYSDLLLHHMGDSLSDGVTQGGATPDEFRTAPLWGVGQRVFFLHDGRTSDLLEAIEAHRSRGSEANGVIERFNMLTAEEAQDIINFLRAL